MKMPRITLGAVWLALPAALALVYVWTAVDFPVDFWHRISSGRLMWRTGALAGRDAFTCTIVGREIINQTWAAELAMFGLFRTGGFPMAQFTAGLCYAAAVAVITWLIYHRSCDARVAAGLAVVVLLLGASNFGVRAQAFSVVLFAVELAVLWRWPTRWGTIAAVAVVELVWTNMHGAFPLGVVLPGVFFTATAWRTWREGRLRAMLADEALRCYFACVLVAAGAMFCNPHPHKTMDYVLGVASKASQRHIEEWLPTALGTYAGGAFALSVVGVVVLLLSGRKRLDAIEVLLILAFAVLAGRAQRMVIWWALVMPPVVAPQVAAVAARWRARPEKRSVLSFVILSLLVVLIAMSTPWTRAYNPLLPPGKRHAHAHDEPRAVVEFLQAGSYQGRAFNPMEWGGYLTWHLDPKVKVFVDGRVDFFPDEVWNDYVRVGAAARDWEAVLDRYDVELVIWNRRLGNHLPDVLERSPHWKNVYRDELGTVFVRNSADGR